MNGRVRAGRTQPEGDVSKSDSFSPQLNIRAKERRDAHLVLIPMGACGVAELGAGRGAEKATLALGGSEHHNVTTL